MPALRHALPYDAASVTALVIDDEPCVRHVLHRMLEPDICRVVEASDGEAGLRLVDEDSPAVDVVITDLTMPKLDGYDVVEVLTQHRPDLPIVLVSGYGGTDEPEFDARYNIPVLDKPFTQEHVCSLVSLLISDSRQVRARSRQMRDRAADARRTSMALQEQNQAIRRRIDLVQVARTNHARRIEDRRRGAGDHAGFMSSRNTEHIAARLRAELAAQHPSIPAHTWHPVLGGNPQTHHPEPDSGHVWIDVEGRVRLLPTEYFEFTKNLGGG
jgi:CheY-like chemotaxis protein